MSDDVNDRGLSRKHILESIDRSLARIGTDYVDVYFCHRFDDETPVEETVRAMDDLVERMAMLPYVIGAIGIAIVLGGAVVTESVFGLPGLGRLTVEAVLSRDFPTIQTVILMFSVVYVLVNLLIDISYTFFDPRIRY